MKTKSQTSILRDYRSRKRAKMIDVMGGCCQICGYNKCANALEYHHLDPSLKDFTISSKWARSWEATCDELKKCILLCANCHREVHAGLIDTSNLKSSFSQEKANEMTQTIENAKHHQHYYCHRCGVEIATRKAYYCVDCAKLMSRKAVRPNREELKKEVRENSLLSLAEKYQVSDNAIRKWCKAEGLPIHKKEIDAYTDEEWALI